MVGRDPVKSAKFSFLKPFCLGELQNDTCQTPAGVAAITYDINPLVAKITYAGLWNHN